MPDALRVYLSVPLVKNRDLRLARRIARVLAGSGCKIVSGWVLRESLPWHLSPSYIYGRDTKGVRRCDLLVAEVSRPSHGVGMELMLAHVMGKRILCLQRRGVRLSYMVRGLPRAELLTYESHQELERSLAARLRRLKSKRQKSV